MSEKNEEEKATMTLGELAGKLSEASQSKLLALFTMSVIRSATAEGDPNITDEQKESLRYEYTLFAAEIDKRHLEVRGATPSIIHKV